MIEVEYHSDLKEVQSDPALAALLGGEAGTAPFDRLDWWQALADHCAMEPLLVVARKGSMRAVLPLRRANGRLEALANWYTFRTRPVITPGADAAALLSAIARDLAARSHRVVFSGVPDEDGSLALLQSAFAASGWRIDCEPCDTNHVLELAGRSYGEYLAMRPGKVRTTLRRKAAKVEVEVLRHFDADVWADYETIYQSSWKPAEGSPAFLRAFAEAEGAAGRLRLAIARAPGEGGPRAVAAQMWTVEGNTAFIHKLAHMEDARELSPGTTLSAALFEHVIDIDRVAIVDFGTGDDTYKRDWMEQVRTRYRLDMLRPRHPRSWPVLVRRMLSRLARRANHG